MLFIKYHLLKTILNCKIVKIKECNNSDVKKIRCFMACISGLQNFSYDEALAAAIQNSEETALYEQDSRIAKELEESAAEQSKKKFKLKVVEQPEDGNCLFHSLTSGLP